MKCLEFQIETMKSQRNDIFIAIFKNAFLEPAVAGDIIIGQYKNQNVAPLELLILFLINCYRYSAPLELDAE